MKNSFLQELGIELKDIQSWDQIEAFNRTLNYMTREMKLSAGYGHSGNAYGNDRPVPDAVIESIDSIGAEGDGQST